MQHSHLSIILNIHVYDFVNYFLYFLHHHFIIHVHERHTIYIQKIQEKSFYSNNNQVNNSKYFYIAVSRIISNSNVNQINLLNKS